MQLTINRKQFDAILTQAINAISNNVVIPILTGVRLKLTNQNLIVTTSNADISLVQSIPVNDDHQPLTNVQSGDIVLPAKYLQKLVRKFTGDTVKLKTSNKPGTISVSSGRSKFKLAYINGNQYPHMPEIDQGQHYQITNHGLQLIFEQDLISAEIGESRPILNGINFVINPDDNKLKAVATDSHRLSRTIIGTQEIDQTNQEINETVPTTSLKAMQKITHNYPDDQIIDLYHNSELKQLKFNLDNLTIFVRSLDGDYPDTERLLPTDPKIELTIERQNLYQIMDRMSLVSSKNEVVNLTINNDGTAIVNNDDLDENRSASEPLNPTAVKFNDPALKNEPFKIAFNFDYIKEGLKAMTSDEVTLKFWSTLRPFTITDPKDKDKNFIYLVTPIRVF